MQQIDAESVEKIISAKLLELGKISVNSDSKNLNKVNEPGK